jgi:hypothetical protein
LLSTPQAWDLLERLAGPALGDWRAGSPWRTAGAAPPVPGVRQLLEELCARGSDRKRRLFASGLSRLKCPGLRYKESRRAVEVAELYSDGQVGSDALREAEVAAWRVWMDNPRGGPAEEAARAAALPWAEEAARTVALALRGVSVDASPSDWNAAYELALRVASPEARYQLVAAANAIEAEVRLAVEVTSDRLANALLHDLLGGSSREEKRTNPGTRDDNHAVRLLARAAYEDRQLPSGHLDAVLLAVLADALEEAGCREAELLAHLRGPGPHFRGCWGLDLVLGRR